jgi:leader peptidase (prepilin peptidase)/N-methyltransferase
VVALYLALLGTAMAWDMARARIPNRLVYPATLLALALAPWGPPAAWWPGWGAYANALAGLGGALGVLLPVYLLARGRMGAGDVKLAGLIGAMGGFPVGLVALGLAFLSGGVAALALLALRRARLHDTLPYGLFLGGGGVMALLWGKDLLRAYLTLLGVAR